VTLVQSRFTFGHGSSLGRVREINEDYHRVKTYQTPRGQLTFLAVADGMGGAAAGEYASKIAVDTVTEALGRYVKLLDEGKTPMPLDRVLERSIIAANKAILQFAAAEPGRDGMGTTLTIMVVLGKDAVLGHVGDTRAYLLRKGELRQISRDHSWVAEQVEKGILTPEAAENHQYRNLLSKALGTRPQIEPDIVNFTITPGDTYALATDGLHGLVSDREFFDELSGGRSPQTAVDYWIDLANQRGGHDNITVVVVKVAS
jgi:protein phosphatase